MEPVLLCTWGDILESYPVHLLQTPKRGITESSRYSLDGVTQMMTFQLPDESTGTIRTDKELSRDHVHVLLCGFSVSSAYMMTGAGVFHPSTQASCKAILPLFPLVPQNLHSSLKNSPCLMLGMKDKSLFPSFSSFAPNLPV